MRDPILYETSPFKKGRPPKEIRHGDGENSGLLAGKTVLRQTDPRWRWHRASPLAYLCAGIAQKMRFQTKPRNMNDLGHTTKGETLGIETHVLIDSDAPQERIMDLMDEAENACMAHHALRNPIPWSSRLIYNGKEVISRKG